MNGAQFYPEGAEYQSQLLQGLKPDIDSIGFVGTTEVMPCYKARFRCAFFAACSSRRVGKGGWTTGKKQSSMIWGFGGPLIEQRAAR
jgi:hypothetical protein